MENKVASLLTQEQYNWIKTVNLDNRFQKIIENDICAKIEPLIDKYLFFDSFDKIYYYYPSNNLISQMNNIMKEKITATLMTKEQYDWARSHTNDFSEVIDILGDIEPKIPKTLFIENNSEKYYYYPQSNNIETILLNDAQLNYIRNNNKDGRIIQIKDPEI